MANVLVTGGAGFIGSHLTAHMVQLGHHVRVFDDFSTGRRENLAPVRDRVELFECDLRHPEECMRACMDIEFVFHQAAIPSVPKSLEQPQASHDVNVDGTFNLLRAAERHKIRRFIYAGSSSVYGDTVESPKHEDMKPMPLSPYAVQKLTGEAYCRAFYECYGLETISLRYFNVFGPRQDPHSQYAAAIPAFVSSIVAGEAPTVYGDGEQTRDFTYIDNVVHGNILAMNAAKTRGEAVNVACGERISINRVIAEINRLMGTDVQPRYAPRRQGDVKDSCADVRLARTLLGYTPRIEFEDGLRTVIEYYRKVAGQQIEGRP